MNKKYLIIVVFLIVVVGAFFFMNKGEDSFTDQPGADVVRFVAQDKMVKDKGYLVTLYSEVKADSVRIDDTGSFTKEDMLFDLTEEDLSASLSSALPFRKHDIYSVYGVMDTSEIGVITLPTITVISEGIEYTSKPKKVEVVDSLQIPAEGDFLLRWHQDKQNLKVGEKTTVTLFQYSKYVNHYFDTVNQTSLFNPTLDEAVGIPEFSKLIKGKLKVLSSDLGFMAGTETNVLVNDEMFIRVNVITLELEALEAGEFTLPATEGSARLYPSTTDAVGKGQLDDNNDEVTTLNNIKSNSLIFKVTE